jgi:hypothetical protein
LREEPNYTNKLSAHPAYLNDENHGPAQSKIRAAKKNAAMFWRGEAGRGAETNEENEKPQIRFRMLTSVS